MFHIVLSFQHNIPWPGFLQARFNIPVDGRPMEEMIAYDCRWRNREPCTCIPDVTLPPCVEFPWLYAKISASNLPAAGTSAKPVSTTNVTATSHPNSQNSASEKTPQQSQPSTAAATASTAGSELAPQTSQNQPQGPNGGDPNPSNSSSTTPASNPIQSPSSSATLPAPASNATSEAKPVAASDGKHTLWLG